MLEYMQNQKEEKLRLTVDINSTEIEQMTALKDATNIRTNSKLIKALIKAAFLELKNNQ